MSTVKFDVGVLKAAIASLNNCEVIKTNKIASVAVIGKTESLLKAFTEAVEKVPDDQVNKLPDNVIDFYMSYINPIEETNTEEKIPKEEKEMEKKEVKKSVEKKDVKPVAKPKATAPVAKKPVAPVKKEVKPVAKPKAPVTKAPVKKETKPIAKPKADKKLVEKDLFGYKIGSQASVIDKDLIAGATVKEMAKNCKSTESRVRSHLYTLIKIKGFPITVKDGKYIYVKGKKK